MGKVEHIKQDLKNLKKEELETFNFTGTFMEWCPTKFLLLLLFFVFFLSKILAVGLLQQ